MDKYTEALLKEPWAPIVDDNERKGFLEAVREAYEFALQEGIRANTLLIDKDFAKVSGCIFCSNGMPVSRTGYPCRR